MASAQGERGGALFTRNELRWTQHRELVLCFYGGGRRRGIFICPPVLSVRSPTCGSLMLMLWTQSYIFFCLYATLGDFGTGVAAAGDQREQQRASLLDNNTSSALGWKQQIALLRRMRTVPKTISPVDLRRVAHKEATAAGAKLSGTLPQGGEAVRSITREEAGVAAAVEPTATLSLPATATAAGKAERSTESAAAVSTLSRGPARATAAATCETRRSTVEHAGAGGVTAAIPLHALGLLGFTDAAAEEGETLSEGSTVRQLNSVRPAIVSMSAQQLREGVSYLPKRFTGGITRRLSAKTHTRVATEAATTERVPEGWQTLQFKLDELMGDVTEYAQLRREREFNEAARKYAGEDAIPEEEVSMLDHARSDLNRLRNRKDRWIRLMLSSLAVCACAVFSLLPFLGQKEFSKAQLDDEYQRRRQTMFRLSSWVALSGFLTGLFGNWRRRALNRKIYLQELETDRIAFEAAAGIRPTKKNVLGPSRKEIEQHKKALRKKAKEQKMWKEWNK